MFLKPSRFTTFSACALGALALLNIPLAHGVAPNVRLIENPIVLLVGVVFLISVVLALVSAVFHWGEAYYYGSSLLCLGSISFLAVVPFLAIILYSAAPYWVKIFTATFYGLVTSFGVEGLSSSMGAYLAMKHCDR